MKIYGHRGAAGLVAENTLESISKALEHEVDGIEIDVHCCKTGELIVIHDETLDRTTNGKGYIEEYSLQELQNIKTLAGFAIPTLEEVLQLIDARCELNVELKGKGTALPSLTLLEKYINATSWEYDHFVISSFDHPQLFEVKKATSKFKIGVLTEENITMALPVAKELEAYAIHPPITSLTAETVEAAHTNAHKVYVWTVNEKKQMLQSKKWNVDTIITDFPNLAE